MKWILYIIIAFALLASCSSTKQLTLPPDRTMDHLDFHINIDTIIFQDKRKDVSAQTDINLDNKEAGEHVPILTDSHKEAIKETIYTNTIYQEEEAFKVIVELMEAKKIFSATPEVEREEVIIKIKLRANSTMRGMWTEAEGTHYVSSDNAKNDHFEELYLRSLKNVTHMCLEMMKSNKER